MSHYRSNLRDLEFNLFEVYGADRYFDAATSMDRATATGVLHELETVASGPLAASFVDADRNPPVYDPATHSAPCRSRSRSRTGPLADGEWWRLELRPDLGGYGATPSLRWAAAELLLGANPALFMYSGGPNFASVIYRNGTPEQQVMAETIIDKRLGGHHGAHRAGRRQRRRRRPDQGHPAAGRQLAPGGRQAVHHLRRTRPDATTSSTWCWPVPRAPASRTGPGPRV